MLLDFNKAFVDIVVVGKERKVIGLVEEDPAEPLDDDKFSDDNEIMEMECIEV